MSPSRGGGSPWNSPPLLRFRSTPHLCLPIKYLCGVLLTILLGLLCLVSLPIVLLLRLICFLTHKCNRGHSCTLHHCDLHWPCIGTTPDRAVVTLHTDTDPNVVALQLNRLLSRRGSRCFSAGAEESQAPYESVVVWDQSRTRLKYVEDLRAVLNEPHGLPPNACSCVVVSGFANTPQNPSSSSLLIFSLRPRAHSFCLPRLLALYSDAQLVFEVEPRVSRPFVNTPHPRLNVPLCICHGVYQTFQFVCRGPLSVLCRSMERQSPVWKALSADHARGNATNIRKAGPPSEEESSLMNPPLEEVVVLSPKNDAQPKISSVSVAPPTRSVAWIRVRHTDSLLRAERLLRAATVELLTALVSGALRQHFRDQGIRHPPDVGATLAVSCRDFVPVEAHRSCEAVMLPLRLPTSVEGAIPRAWAVQRRMANALDGVLPNALKVTQFVGSVCLPPSICEKLACGLYGDNAVHISFIRAGGELSLDGVRIQSILLFPSVPDKVCASFCFVQCGTEMMLSVSLDNNIFPKPASILANFKNEVRLLVEQLSMRLLTLTQATFLPERMPLRVEPDAEEYCQDSEEFARSHPRPLITIRKPPSESKTEKADSEYTLEELQDLLTTVQAELDGMRANPQGDRHEYIRKLTELENRMQRFHECITQKLGAGVTDLVQEDSHMATSAVAELLAPYRQESGMTGRRFSREYIRTDSSTSRKNSL